jgi:hypothetical protein
MKQEDLLNSYDLLNELDLVHSGTIISSYFLSELFKIKDTDSLEYLSAIITLRKIIEINSGLFCIIKDKKDIYIKYPEEGRLTSKKRRKKAFEILQNTLDTLLNTDLDEFNDEKEKMKHLHETNVMIFINGKLIDNE